MILNILKAIFILACAIVVLVVFALGYVALRYLVVPAIIFAWIVWAIYHSVKEEK